MAESFYLRVRGEVKGPLTREQVIGLIRKKRLGRHHELSTNAVVWKRAGEFEGFFESQAPVYSEPIVEQDTSEDDQSSEVSTGAKSSSGGFASSPDGGGDDEWHYAKGMNTHGPISLREIRAMLATGRLQGSDRVWNEAMSDWVPAEDVPQLMGSIRESSPYATGKTRNSEPMHRAGFFEVLFGITSGTAIPSPAYQKFPNLCRYLMIAESVARILFVLELIGAAAWYVIIVAGAVMTERGAIIFGMIFGGGLALLIAACLFWFLFIASLAFLELARVLIRIEDNTTSG